jgi:paraquat-inducible protein B
MSEHGPDRPAPRGVAEAVIQTRTRPSIIWVIPLVAALAGAFVAWRAISERGPAITIHFADAEGLEAGKTKIKYKDVEVGLVEGIELAEDLSGVIVHARMVKEFSPHLTDKTRFWVMRARVAGGQVSGLGTLFSGAYIGVDPVREGASAREFRGLDEAPIVTTDEPGRHFTLRSYRAGSFAVGTPVFYRKIKVGEVVSAELDPSGEFVTVRVFVHAPHDGRVKGETRFWNASGFDVAMTAEGVTVDTESVASILIGGIAFDTPSDGGAPAEADAVFPLYESREASERRTYTQKVVWLVHFDQSVRGLVPGSPVEFRGIRVGEVRDVRLAFDPKGQRIRIPVLIEVEPERIGQAAGRSPEERRAALDRMVASGLRAQLKSGNLLTGQLTVALDMHQNAPPAEVDWTGGPYPEFPTIPTPLEEITADLTSIVQKIDRMPLEEIGADLRDSLAAMAELTRQINSDVVPRLDSALASADRTLASANSMIGIDSPVNQELRRALVELTEATRSLGLAADQFEREPESVIRGRE